MTTTTRTRIATLDRLRGAGIVLMVADHLLVLTDPTNVLRFTLTRLSLPLFIYCAIATPPRRPRARRYAPAIALETIAAASTPLGAPGPVALIYALKLTLWHRPRWAHTIGLFGLIQALYLPLGWTGYEPGLVCAWVPIVLAAGRHLDRAARRLPHLLEPIGRRPLAWYCGHLALLVPLAHALAP